MPRKLIVVDYDVLPSVVDATAALAPGAPQLWDQAPGNLSYRFQKGDAAAVQAAIAGAAHVVELELINNRIVICAMEPRGAIGTYDDAHGFHLQYSGAGVHALKSQLADTVFRVPPQRMRVSCPDVGGGFGVKNALYPEWVMLLWAARHLRRPVKWLSERVEDFVTTAQGRANATRARLALDADGNFLALDVATVADLGAYHVHRRPGQLHQRAGQRDGQRLRHSGDLHGRARRLHQHRADRRLSRRRQARGQLHDRAADRRRRPSLRLRSDRAAPAQPGGAVSLSQGAGHGDRLRPLRRQPRRRRHRRRPRRLRRPPRRRRRPRQAARHRRHLLHGDRARRAERGCGNPFRRRRQGGAAGRHAIQRHGSRNDLSADRRRPARPADRGVPLHAGRHCLGARRQRPWRRALDAHGRRRAVQGGRRDAGQGQRDRRAAAAGNAGPGRVRRRALHRARRSLARHRPAQRRPRRARSRQCAGRRSPRPGHLCLEPARPDHLSRTAATSPRSRSIPKPARSRWNAIPRWTISARC